MTGDDRHKSLEPRESVAAVSTDTDPPINVSPIVWLALDSVFGWTRLAKITDAEARYREGLEHLKRATHRLDVLPQTLAREDLIAEEKHKAELAKLRYQAKVDEMARNRLILEDARERERIRAEIRRYKQAGKTEPAAPEDDISDPAIQAIRDEIKRYIEREAYIEPLIREANEKIDRLVAKGNITPVDADEKKARVADYIRSKVMQV